MSYNTHAYSRAFEDFGEIKQNPMRIEKMLFFCMSTDQERRVRGYENARLLPSLLNLLSISARAARCG